MLFSNPILILQQKDLLIFSKMQQTAPNPQKGKSYILQEALDFKRVRSR
jgi:hypothetical protein